MPCGGTYKSNNKNKKVRRPAAQDWCARARRSSGICFLKLTLCHAWLVAERVHILVEQEDRRSPSITSVEVKWMWGWTPAAVLGAVFCHDNTHTSKSWLLSSLFSHTSQTHLRIWGVLTLFLNPEEGGLKNWNRYPCWGRYTDTKVRISFRSYSLAFELQKRRKSAASTINVLFESFTSSPVGSCLFSTISCSSYLIW